MNRYSLLCLVSLSLFACGSEVTDPEGANSSEGLGISSTDPFSSGTVVPLSSGVSSPVLTSSGIVIPLSSGASSPVLTSSGIVVPLSSGGSSISPASSGVVIPRSSSSAVNPPGSSAVLPSSSGSTGLEKLVYAVNAGGTKTTMGGIEYQDDKFASGGSPHAVTDPIAGTTEGTLFQSEVYGSFKYEVPVSNATYKVILHFAELYQKAAGARTFNVTVEGKVLATELDLFAKAGALTAYSDTIEGVKVTDGTLTIDLESIVDNATICGFAIFSSDGGVVVTPPPPPPIEPGTASKEDTGRDCVVGTPTGANGGSGTVLPDPFTKWDGTQVKTMEDWRCRRREIVVEVEKRILGEKAPPPQTVTGTVTNSGYTVNVTNAGKSMSFSGKITLPTSGKAPYPAVIVIGGFNSLNSDVLSSEGVAVIAYDNSAILAETSGNYSTGKYFDVNPDQKGKTGSLVAWAWGVSRLIDVIEKNPGVIDPTKLGIHGCSRLGKAAFVIGAFDERIALGLPLEPGTGGPAPLRALPSLGGQTVASANGEANWFGPMSKSYASSMAVDMDDVASMYAPRGLLMMDNPHIDHLAYKANYLGSAAAAKVFKAMGRSDALWYLGNSGNGNHCATRAEYGAPLRAMIKKFLKGDGAATTGGLDKHANHGTINVDGWTSGWKEGTISK